MVEEISVDDLGVDPENVRDRPFHPGRDSDAKLAESVEKQGVNHPLIVRPSDRIESDYGIICGSRRYGAAIEAGIFEVSCIIRDVDDVTAAGLSVSENRDRDDVPTYKEAFTAIEHYHRLDGVGKTEKMETLAEKFGCSRPTISQYLNIDQLPDDVQELVKDPFEWSEEVKQVVQEDVPEIDGSGRSLSVEKASKLSSKLEDVGAQQKVGDKTLSEDDLLTFAAQSINKSREDVSTAAEVLATDDSISVEKSWDVADTAREYDIGVEGAIANVDTSEQTMRKSISIEVELPNMYTGLIEQAAVERNMKKKELVRYYVKEGLEEDGMEVN